MNEQRKRERIEAIRHTVNMAVTNLDKIELLKTALEMDNGAGTASILTNMAIKRLTEQQNVASLSEHQISHLKVLAKHKKLAEAGDHSAQERYIVERGWLLQSGVKIPSDLSPFETE